jgi:hypothetical protein
MGGEYIMHGEKRNAIGFWWECHKEDLDVGAKIILK